MPEDFMIERIIAGPFFTNCYLFACKTTKDCAVIDPGADAKFIKKRLKELTLNPRCIIITHGHIDHIAGLNEFNLPVYAGCADVEYFADPKLNLSVLFLKPQTFKKPSYVLREGNTIKVGQCSLKVLEVPGHTPGSICLVNDKVLFSGDTLFKGSLGRTDFPGASSWVLLKMVKTKLLVLKDFVAVYPGHGEATTIGQEKNNNPFICEK